MIHEIQTISAEVNLVIHSGLCVALPFKPPKKFARKRRFFKFKSGAKLYIILKFLA